MTESTFVVAVVVVVVMVVVVIVVVVVVVVVIVDDAPFIATAESVNDTPNVVPCALAFMMLTHADTMIIFKSDFDIANHQNQHHHHLHHLHHRHYDERDFF